MVIIKFYRLLMLLIIIFDSNLSYSIIEFSGLFGYSKKNYGENKQNNMVERSYSLGAAFYFSNYTAFELGFSQYEDIVTTNDRVTLATDLFITSVQNRVINQIYSLSLKQMLAPKGAILVPYVSLGYAKRMSEGETDYTYSSIGQELIVTVMDGKKTQDSVTASFGLSLQMTKVISITGSVRTVFEFFEMNQAKDYLIYQFGLSWWIH